MHNLMQDIRYGFRMLMKKPGFTFIAVLTLALGIGANTAIFSVVNAVLLRPLPYPDADRLVFIQSTDRSTGRPYSVSYPNFLDWRKQSRSFDAMAAFRPDRMLLAGREGVEPVQGEMVSGDYFDVLGISTALGRAFTPEDNKTPDAHPVALVSYQFWQNRQGGDPAFIGSTITINDAPYKIIGIMPEGFRGFSSHADIWVPIVMFDTVNPSLKPYKFLTLRDTSWHSVVGRLRPGVTIAQARTDLDVVADGLSMLYPKENKKVGISLKSAHEALVGDLEAMLFILLGAVGFVLLIACANVANLCFARAADRTREIAVRLAIGAQRGRLIRQLLTESLLLALMGGVCGVLLAAWGVDALIAFIPVEMPGFIHIHIDMAVLGFTLVISVLIGLAFGTGPAFGMVRVDLNESLKEGMSRTGSSPRRRRIRSLLVVTETTLACVLLIGAGLMIMSFIRMRMFDPGFRTDHLLTMRIGIPDRYGADQEKAVLARRILESIRTLPTVETVSLTSHIYYGEGYLNSLVTPARPKTPVPDDGEMVYRQVVAPDNMATMGIPLLQGREFTMRDDETAPRVAIVSASFIKRYWNGEDGIGKRFKFGRIDAEPEWFEIVGVVGDVHPVFTLTDAREFPQVYTPMFQAPVGGNPGLVIRTGVDPINVIESIRRTIRDIEPMIPIYRVRTMDQLMADHTTDTRFITLLMGLFAVVALMLAAAGIYGVMSYVVSQQSHEIGIRMALGAQPRDILGLIIRQGMLLTLIGITSGLVGAVTLTRFLTGMLFGVTATNPMVFAGVSALLAAVALLACYLPARRTLRVDPLTALRYE